jgi:succinoglycan biosynthesis protein ExoW
MTSVAVIIPYFQRKPGILNRALTSILAQLLPDGVEVNIIVVDDGSPLPARGEITGLEVAAPFRLSLHQQKNAGVVAARNLALDLVPAATDYLAFLDSDDMWHPGHLARALRGLDAGCDYYFCDHDRVGHHDSFFTGIGFTPFLSPANTRPLASEVREIDKDALFGFFVRMFVSQISTVVFRRAVAPALRFNPMLHNAGEDHLFLLQAVEAARRICFSPDVQVTCGDGINIYASRYSWHDPGHLIRHMSEILKLYSFRDTLRLTNDNRSDVARRVRFYRTKFAYLSARYFLKHREAWPHELVTMTRKDPRFWLWYPAYVFCVSTGYALRLYDPLKEAS